MEICKAPTPWLKVLNKHSITHIMYIEMENVTKTVSDRYIALYSAASQPWADDSSAQACVLET